jgi:VCBS repeat protein
MHVSRTFWVFVCFGFSFFQVFAPGSAVGQISYRNLSAQNRIQIANPRPKLTKTSELPRRFMGWRDAIKRGPEYQARFRRPRADHTIARESKTHPSSTSTLFLSSAGPVANLPGIQMRPVMPAGFLPVSVAMADFNRDGNIDWVIANAGDNNLWLYVGNGDGTWQVPVILPIKGLTPTAVATADLRGIGKKTSP